jgi:hypothetical protein
LKLGACAPKFGHAAAGILSSHGFPVRLVAPIMIGASLMDSGIGVLIAFRRTSATGSSRVSWPLSAIWQEAPS